MKLTNVAFLPNTGKKRWGYLKSDFLRDACLLDPCFFDDFFNMSPSNKEVKKRPFCIFEGIVEGKLVMVPLTNKTKRDSRHYKAYIHEISKCKDNVKDRDLKMWSADLSKMFLIKESEWSDFIGKPKAAHLSDTEWAALRKRVRKQVEIKHDNLHTNNCVNFDGLVTKVRDYRRTLYGYLSKKTSTAGRKDSELHSLIERQKCLIEYFDDLYTKLVQIEKAEHISLIEMRNCGLKAIRGIADAILEIGKRKDLLTQDECIGLLTESQDYTRWQLSYIATYFKNKD